ncbi:unnamed protein product [Penicillium pancosmium]
MTFATLLGIAALKGIVIRQAAKKLKDEAKAKRKALDKVHQEATKKLTDEVKAKRKALDKAQQEAAKMLKDKMNA